MGPIWGPKYINDTDLGLKYMTRTLSYFGLFGAARYTRMCVWSRVANMCSMLVIVAVLETPAQRLDPERPFESLSYPIVHDDAPRLHFVTQMNCNIGEPVFEIHVKLSIPSAPFKLYLAHSTKALSNLRSGRRIYYAHELTAPAAHSKLCP